VVDRNEVNGSLDTNVQEGVVVGSPNLKADLLKVLSVMKQRFGGWFVRLVVNVNLESVLVVVLGVAAHEESFKGQKERGEWVAEQLGGGAVVPSHVEDRVDVPEVKEVVDFIVY
jgi:hypothetical protein